MKQLLTTIIISLSLVITGITVFASNTSSTSYKQALISTFKGIDKYLGIVNLCDPNGKICQTRHAFKNSENGRIFLTSFITTDDNGNTIPKYQYHRNDVWAQKSNDSRWEYMVLIDKWYYFSF